VRVRFAIGPVDAAIARTWLANSRRIIACLQRTPAAVSFILSPPLLEVMDGYLAAWQDVAATSDVFFWQTDADPALIADVAAEWIRVDSLTDEELADLGCAWAGPECAPFYEAVLSGVAAALSDGPGEAELVSDLRARVVDGPNE
jgi:hypothetical protein